MKISDRLGNINPKEIDANMDEIVPDSTDTPTERRPSIMRSCIPFLAESTYE